MFHLFAEIVCGGAKHEGGSLVVMVSTELMVLLARARLVGRKELHLVLVDGGKMLMLAQLVVVDGVSGCGGGGVHVARPSLGLYSLREQAERCCLDCVLMGLASRQVCSTLGGGVSRSAVRRRLMGPLGREKRQCDACCFARP